MANRNLSLTERAEARRDKQIPTPVISFTLEEIKAHFEEGIRSVESKYEIASSLQEGGKSDAAKDIWRSQIVFLESTLDFFLHEISKYGVLRIFQGNWPKSEKYNKFSVPMHSLEQGIRSPETTTWFTEYLNQRFSREVYLSYEQMKEQMNLLGLNFGTLVNDAFPRPADPAVPYRTGATIIADLFERRNQIVHQGDRSHATAEQNDISREYVEQCVNDVKTLVSKIYECVQKKDLHS